MTSAEEILEALGEEQRKVALATRGPVCVIAGAGTGKTRAITHRIAYAAAIGVMDPQRVLAITIIPLLVLLHLKFWLTKEFTLNLFIQDAAGCPYLKKVI